MDHLQAVNRWRSSVTFLDEMPREAGLVEEHFFSCVECAEDARVAATMRDGVRPGTGAYECQFRARWIGVPCAVPRPNQGWRGLWRCAVGRGRNLAIGLGYRTGSGPLMSPEWPTRLR
jgi:hypothetical protein